MVLRVAFVTPLRYPGGKGRLGPWLAELLRDNSISGGTYVEPYAGGAGAAMYLLVYGYVNHIIINDIDPFVYAFWWSVLNRTQDLLDRIQSTPVTIDSWEQQKTVHEHPNEFTPTDLGFATFFLNRTNRSGILSGGVIGGKAQTGTYAMSARYDSDDLCRRIERIARRRRHISLYNADAIALLDDLRSGLISPTLVYCDPPYYNKGAQLYRNAYAPDDHAKIAAFMQGLSVPWLISYDDCEQVRSLYSGTSSTTMSFKYSSTTRRPAATEIIFYANLRISHRPWLKR